METTWSRYLNLAKRWAWLALLSILICSALGYVVTKLITPTYTASALVGVNLESNASTTQVPDTTNSIQIVPTYAQLITTPMILKPVLALHQGLTLQILKTKVSVSPIANTQLIQIDVTDHNPQMAMQIANEISQTFAQYVNAHLLSNVQVIPAEIPITPTSPKTLQDVGIGAATGLVLVGLYLAFLDAAATRRRAASMQSSNVQGNPLGNSQTNQVSVWDQQTFHQTASPSYGGIQSQTSNPIEATNTGDKDFFSTVQKDFQGRRLN